MVRNVIGSILALAGATAAVWSPFRAWYDGRHGSDYRIGDLFGGITDAKAEVIGSILLPFAFAALVTLVGVVLRSRLLVALAGLIVLGFTVLWMVRVGQAEGGLTVGGARRGLDDGVFFALGGGVLLLLAAGVMSGRRRAHATRVDGHEPPRQAGPRQGEAPTDPHAPVYPHDEGSPTRTMDEPHWDQQGRGQWSQGQGGQGGQSGQDPWDQGRGGHGPYPDEPPPRHRS
ncbi:hypothetical protein ACFYV5_28440 [Streptomyces sp. NPDC003035]|uniref:hypothetical protein n=1 Tax=Streptomyces sp. NPDC003035 TaxID=3364676 RepID=UPI00367E9666